MQPRQEHDPPTIPAIGWQLLIILSGLLLTATLFLPGQRELTGSGFPISEFYRALQVAYQGPARYYFVLDPRAVFGFCLRFAIYVQGLIFAAGALARMCRSAPLIRLTNIVNVVWAFTWWLPLVSLVVVVFTYYLQKGVNGPVILVLLGASVVPIYLIRAVRDRAWNWWCIAWLGTWGALAWFGVCARDGSVGVRVALLANLVLVVAVFGEARRLSRRSAPATLAGLTFCALGKRRTGSAFPVATA